VVATDRGEARQVPILALDEIDSTNAEARRRAEAGETGPLWITAQRQTAGRGRRGRIWESGPGGNLAATLLTTTDQPLAQAAQISFIAALAVADLVRAYVTRDQAKVKWPNDVLVRGRKIAGVLIESGPAPGAGQWLATGIGVNLTHEPAAAERPATSFALEGCDPPPAPDEALTALAARLQDWSDVWRDEGFAPIAKAWTDRAYGLGQACRAHLGAQVIDGVAEGIDLDGALRLRLADGVVRRISAGDVFFGEA